MAETPRHGTQGQESRALRERNRDTWDQWTRVNFESEFYDVESFAAGFADGKNPRRQRLDALESELLGDVRGKSLLHLQCHFGMDTLTQARRGAQVTGVDYSAEAIQRARELAARVGMPEATFVHSDVYDLPDHLEGSFDIVFTSIGVLSWLNDLDAWARVIAHFLKPGGHFVILEGHPFAWVFDDESAEHEFRVRYPYFEGNPLRLEQTGVYSNEQADVSTVTFEWAHSISEIVTALLQAGLRLDAMREYPFLAWKMFPWMTPQPDGSWHLTESDPQLPLMFSLQATRPLP